MKISSNSLRIGIAVAVIVGTIGWLALYRLQRQQELLRHHRRTRRMGDKAYKSNMRVEGFVKPGSIEQNGTHVTFVHRTSLKATLPRPPPAVAQG